VLLWLLEPLLRIAAGQVTTTNCARQSDDQRFPYPSTSTKQTHAFPKFIN
jgi:hypothetical protein